MADIAVVPGSVENPGATATLLVRVVALQWSEVQLNTL